MAGKGPLTANTEPVDITVSPDHGGSMVEGVLPAGDPAEKNSDEETKDDSKPMLETDHVYGSFVLTQQALFYRNLLQALRSPIGTILDLLLPLVLLSVLAYLLHYFEGKSRTTASIETIDAHDWTAPQYSRCRALNYGATSLEEISFPMEWRKLLSFVDLKTSDVDPNLWACSGLSLLAFEDPGTPVDVLSLYFIQTPTEYPNPYKQTTIRDCEDGCNFKTFWEDFMSTVASDDLGHSLTCVDPSDTTCFTGSGPVSKPFKPEGPHYPKFEQYFSTTVVEDAFQKSIVIGEKNDGKMTVENVPPLRASNGEVFPFDLMFPVMTPVEDVEAHLNAVSLADKLFLLYASWKENGKKFDVPPMSLTGDEKIILFNTFRDIFPITNTFSEVFIMSRENSQAYDLQLYEVACLICHQDNRMLFTAEKDEGLCDFVKTFIRSARGEATSRAWSDVLSSQESNKRCKATLETFGTNELSGIYTNHPETFMYQMLQRGEVISNDDQWTTYTQPFVELIYQIGEANKLFNRRFMDLHPHLDLDDKPNAQYLVDTIVMSVGLRQWVRKTINPVLNNLISSVHTRESPSTSGIVTGPTRDAPFPNREGTLNGKLKTMYELSFLLFLFPVLLMSPSIKIMKLQVLDRELKTFSLLQVLGVSQSAYWVSWVIYCVTYNVLTSALLLIALYFWCGITRVDFFIYLMSFFFCLCQQNAFFIFIGCFFKKGGTATLAAAMITMFTLGFSVGLTSTSSLDPAASHSLIAIPPSSIMFIMKIIYSYGIWNVGSYSGVSWSALATRSNGYSWLSVWAITFSSSVIWFFLAIYVTNVMPTDGSVAKPFYFPVAKLMQLFKKEEFEEEPLYEEDLPDSRYFEGIKPGGMLLAKVRNLKKRFKSSGVIVDAVRGVNIDLYTNEVYVLLGHNGAGKTTTIKMIMGAVGASSGTVTIAGADIVLQTSAARRSLGYCPQHDILFPNLTVKEHLKIIGLIKGVPRKTINAEITEILETLDLLTKIDAKVKTLSGGQKRRVCVGMALMGNSKLVLLDEPSTGMDPATRRHLWTMIRKVKESGRAILLTTHFLDEADVLGDRVAIMHAGIVKCEGSGVFLKSMMGTSFFITVTMMEGVTKESIVGSIQTTLPAIRFVSCYNHDVTFSVPADVDPIPALKLLETDSSKIGVTSFSIQAASLESVFLRISDEAHKEVTSSTKCRSESMRDASLDHRKDDVFSRYKAIAMEHKSNAFRDFGLRLCALLKKRLLILKRNVGMLLALVVLPACTLLGNVLLSSLFVKLDTQKGQSLEGNDIARETWRDMDQLTRVPVASDFSCPAGSDVLTFERIDSVQTLADMNRYLLDTYRFDGGEEMPLMALCNDGILHNTQAYSTAYDVASHLWRTCRSGVETFNDVVLHKQTYDFSIGGDSNNFSQASNTAMALGLVPCVVCYFIVKEVQLGQKLQQHLAGARVWEYWIANCIFDMLSFWITGVLCIVILAAMKSPLIVTANEFSATFMSMLLFSFAVMPFTYLVSLLLTKPLRGFIVMMIAGWILASFGSTIPLILLGKGNDWRTDWLYFLPQAALGGCFTKIITYEMFHPFKKMPLFGWDKDTLRRPHLQLLATGLILGAVLAAFDWIKAHPRGIGKEKSQRLQIDDDDVRREAKNIVERYGYGSENAKQHWAQLGVHPGIAPTPFRPNVASNDRNVDPETQNEDIDGLIIQGLSKTFSTGCCRRKKVHAVRDLWFAVPYQQIFGFLGLNGAGKTTTVSICTSSLAPSGGTAYLAGHRLGKSPKNTVGLCTQIDNLIPELTGRDHIRLMSQLNMLPSSISREFEDKVLEHVGIADAADRKTEGYSGGMKRKLSLAIALIGDPAVVFLDEPSSGVDPASRRGLWNVILAARTNRSIVLTTHVLEEVEALADRIGIKKGGELACIGSLATLKARMGRVWMLEVALLPTGDTEKFIEYVSSRFDNAEVMDQSGLRVRVRIPKDHYNVTTILQDINAKKHELAVNSISVSDVSLEAIFVDLNEGQVDDLEK